jgi:predicted DNA-binding antitoxin AbrB/MazE fold protein
MLTIPLIYEQGVFRPLVNVNLPEHTRVSAQIIEQASESPAETFAESDIAAHPLLAIVGLGASKEGPFNASELAEEILAQDIHPIYGWSIREERTDYDSDR